MSRQPMTPGSRGKINSRDKVPCKDGVHAKSCPTSDGDTSLCATYPAARARIRVALWNGQIKELEAFAPTATAAKTAVSKKSDAVLGGRSIGQQRPDIMAYVEKHIVRALGNGDIQPQTADLYRTVAGYRIRNAAKLSRFNAAKFDISTAIAFLEIVRDGKADSPSEQRPHYGDFGMAAALLKGAFVIIQQEFSLPYNFVEQALTSVKIPKTWKRNMVSRSSRALTAGEIDALLAHYERRNKKAAYMVDFITIGAGTGLRVSEILALQNGDLEEVDGVWNLHVRRHIIEETKTRALSNIPGTKAHEEPFMIPNIQPSVVHAIQSRIVLDGLTRKSDWIFATEGQAKNAGERTIIFSSTVRNSMRAAAKKLDFPRAADGGFHVSPHSLRKFYLNWINDKANDDGLTASKVANHSSKTTTNVHYLRKVGHFAPDVSRLGDPMEDIRAISGR
jgi:integrase